MTTSAQDPLQFTTWLAPGLPVALFASIAAHVAGWLGRGHDLDVEAMISGPRQPDQDRFGAGTTDIGFVCPPSYLWLTERARTAVLVPRAPVFDDPRADGRPVYFSDVVVRADAPIESFDDLHRRRIGFNDRSSMSGYLSILSHIAALGLGVEFFAEFRHVGSHRTALDLIVDGELDAAAVDANVFRTWTREHPERRAEVRSITPLGPFPVQPVVMRAALAPELLEATVASLDQQALVEAVRPFGLLGFAPVAAADYEALQPAIDLAQSLD